MQARQEVKGRDCATDVGFVRQVVQFDFGHGRGSDGQAACLNSSLFCSASRPMLQIGSSMLSFRMSSIRLSAGYLLAIARSNRERDWESLLHSSDRTASTDCGRTTPARCIHADARECIHGGRGARDYVSKPVPERDLELPRLHRSISE